VEKEELSEMVGADLTRSAGEFATTVSKRDWHLFTCNSNPSSVIV
jgi:hypothetical protein